ncbi:MAG: sulfatase-like hydrolase/transferase [Candidatus Aminicenantes bacterium]|nr:sulfatase-like hydrolase/transferase [Candidatus Aminicenantes bacterium]
MKKIVKFSILPLSCLLLLLLIFLFLLSPEKKEFERLDLKGYTIDQSDFRVDKRLRKIFFKRGKDEIWLKELPTIKGYPFYIKGKKAVKIAPGISGEVSFYSYLYFDNLKKKEKIQFSFEINREGEIIRIDQITAAHSSCRYVQHLKLKKKDILVCKFKGKGIAFLSTPIIYKKIPLKKRKYVFLIGVDTLRWDQVGAKVGKISLTPNIDRFKKDCLNFGNAYAQCSWTLPSFMSLFTGLYEFNHGVDISNPLDLAIPTLTEKTSETFITFGFHSGMGMRKRWGYSRGFDYYKKVPYTGPLYPGAGQNLFRAAQTLLEETEFPNLFFFLHTYQVHDPYTPPLDFLLKLNNNPPYKRLDVVNQNAPWKTFLPVEEKLKKSLKELYQAEIHAFDSYFGEFIEKLKEMDIYDNAMIVFLSDHGEEFFEHKGWAHSHSLYNELIKVPVMIKFPGSEFKDTRVNDTIGLIDIIPTILSYYNVECGESRIDGFDLMPRIRGGESVHHRKHLVSSITESRYTREIPPKFAIINGDYKLIYNETFSAKDLDYFKPYALPPQTPQIEIYDLKKDPLEKHNIADEKSELLKKLLPLIKKIKNIIKNNTAEKKKKGTPLDEEAKKQLESLGYI